MKMKDIRPKNPIEWIKYRHLEWKWDRILKKSGCSNWYLYFFYNDPDFDLRAQTVRSQFCGYPHVTVVNQSAISWCYEPLWGPRPMHEEVVKWCDQNCRDKYRLHWERVIQDHTGQYTPNGIGGNDELFIGFKNERDFMLFCLRWC